MLDFSARRVSTALLGLAAAMLTAGCSEPDAPSAHAAAKPPADPVASTEHGQIRGTVEDGILTFKGVRYGADTSTTRFAAPAGPDPWDDVREATQYGASCPQTPTGNPGGLFTSWQPEPAPPLSEDCLFLNVWTPALDDGGKRPGLVPWRWLFLRQRVFHRL